MEYLLNYCGLLINNHGNLLISLFLAGLFGSLSHCAGMCGPFILSQIRPIDGKEVTIMQKIYGTALLPYHFGRMTTYVFLAGLASFFAFPVFGYGKEAYLISALLLISGILFIFNAFPILKRYFFRLNLPNLGKYIGYVITPLSIHNNILSRYFLGLCLGFLPCGLVYAALMVVSTMGNIVYSMVAMSLFTIGTMPALIIVAILGRKILSKRDFIYRTIVRIIMVFNGIFLIYLALGGNLI